MSDIPTTPFGQPARAISRLYRDGVAALDRGDFETAVQCLTQVHDQPGPHGTLARYYLAEARAGAGRVAFDLRNYDQAATHFAAALRLNPSSGDLCEFLGRCYAYQGRLDQAIQTWERADARVPLQVEAAVRHALAYWRNGDAARAMDTLQRAARQFPSDAEPQYQLGVLHAAAEEFEPAIERFRAAVGLRPHHADACRRLGQVLAAMHRFEESARALAAAQRLRPWDAGIALELSLALKCACPASAELDQTPTAAVGRTPRDQRGSTLLAERIAVEPDLLDAFLQVPVTPRETELLTTLDAATRDALQKAPRYADLHHHAARLHARRGAPDEAIRAEERALTINPQYVGSMIHLARLYAAADRSDEAVARYQRAIQCGGDYADVHFELGELHRAAGRLGDAREAYRRALNINGSFQRAHAALDALAAA